MTPAPVGAGRPSDASRFVRITDPTACDRLDIQTRARVDYGSFTWLEIGNADLDRLRADGEHPVEVVGAGTVRYGETVIDPSIETVPGTSDGRLKTATSGSLSVVQLIGPPRDTWLAAIRATGATVLQYLPSNAYVLWLDGQPAADAIAGLPFLRWQGPVSARWKIDGVLAKRAARHHHGARVLFVNDGNPNATLRRIEETGSTVVRHEPAQPDGRLLVATVSLGASGPAAIAAIPTTVWLEPAPAAPLLSDERSDAIVAGEVVDGQPLLGYTDWLDEVGVDGSGIIWAVVDSGVDPFHPDLDVVTGVNYPGCETTEPGDDPGDVGHGTPVAGIIAGSGDGAFADPDGFRYGVGVAPGAALVSQNALCGDYSSWPPNGGWQRLSADGLAAGAIGANNSWNSQEGMAHGYQLTERTFDVMVRDGDFDTADIAEPYTIVFSVHNDGPDPQTIQAPTEAKNIIAVGATQNARETGDIEQVSDFSGRGPAVDGRVVPHLVAPGEWVTSARHRDGGIFGLFEIPDTDGLYLTFTGTSAAAPHVSGAAALLSQWWRRRHGGADPSPAMVKALLVNGAVDISGAPPIPNNDEGWGRIDLGRTLRPGVRTLQVDQLVRLDDTGEQWSMPIRVDDPSRPLEVTLAWTDAPGAPGADPALVNDLDLAVSTGSATFLGNVLVDGASVPGGAPDTLNNLEKVVVTAPGTDAIIVVRATRIAGDGVPYVGDASDQDFALACTNCVRVPPSPRHTGRRVGGGP
jgi:subtilisin family serine protease